VETKRVLAALAEVSYFSSNIKGFSRIFCLFSE